MKRKASQQAGKTSKKAKQQQEGAIAARWEAEIKTSEELIPFAAVPCFFGLREGGF